MREIKFRAWNPDEKLMGPPFTIGLFLSAIPMCDNIDNENILYMQFTGLKDKHGKDIYEGDVLRSTSGIFGPVSFEHGTFIWKKDPLGFDVEEEKIEVCLPNRWAQVIGNIYENPELL